MMQPGRANVGAAMIAHGAEQARLLIVVSHVIRKTTDVQFGIVKTVWITAIDEHMGSTETPHVAQRHRLVLEHKVRDRPRHPPSTAEPDA